MRWNSSITGMSLVMALAAKPARAGNAIELYKVYT